MSRPAARRTGDARPATAASLVTEVVDGSWICAVMDAKKFGAGHDVGIAALDGDTGVVCLTEFCDTQAYVKTIRTLALHPPHSILVPEEHRTSSQTASASDAGGSLLAQSIDDSFHATMIGVTRSAWNAQEGARIVDRLLLSRPADEHDDFQEVTELTLQTSNREAILVALSRRYYALSACSALFDHLQETSNHLLHSQALRIRFEAPEGSIFIDPSSMLHMDLIAHPRSSPLPAMQSSNSIDRLLNHCRTPMGQRLLKLNILQPPANHDLVSARLDTVEELVDSPERLHAVDSVLSKLGRISTDMDRLITSLAIEGPRQKETGSGATLRSLKIIGLLIDLNAFLACRPQLLESLHDARSPSLRAIAMFLTGSELDFVDERIKACLNDGMVQDKGALTRRESALFAVKPEFCALLDVARATYKENVQDIINYVEELNATHSLSLSLKKGKTDFHLEAKTQNVRIAVFVNRVASAKGGKVTMTTLELKKMNRKVADSRDEILLLSSEAVETLRTEVIEELAHLYKMAEAIALLDLLHSLALQSSSKGYCRPEFADTLAIKDGRHPLLDSLRATRAVPNDVFADDETNVGILAGPNLSGNTTYLKMIGQLHVMASVGCFVPAGYASFRPISAILTRFSNDDDMEHNLSTFGTEMRTSAGILALANPTTLILIDELGRGTSPNEGLSFACAITEKIIESGASAWCATHFTEMLQALQHHGRVLAQHLDVGQASGEDRLVEGATSCYKVRRGVPSGNQAYGLRAAMISSMPKGVIERAFRIRSVLEHASEQGAQSSLGRSALDRHKFLCKTHHDVSNVLQLDAKTPVEQSLSLLKQIQDGLIGQLSMSDAGDNSTEAGLDVEASSRHE